MVGVQQIDKDVVRTDRSHPYYKGDREEGRRHVGTLKYVCRLCSEVPSHEFGVVQRHRWGCVLIRYSLLMGEGRGIVA